MNKQFKLGPVTITSGDEIPNRMALVLWGPSGCGKTTWAATAPGEKLWMSIGDQEHVSVMGRKDVHVAKLYDLDVDDFFKHGKSNNPFGLDQLLAENDKIETVVVDSMTAVASLALEKAVADRIGAGRGFTPSMEAPGISAYGGRNAITIEVLKGVLRVTAKHNVHCIITAHEDDPTMVEVNGQSIVDHIGIMLGGKIIGQTTWRLSEIWYMSQEDTGGKDRRIAIRPTRRRRPMKTRMFDTLGEPEFKLKYDQKKPDKGQMTIASIISQWNESGGIEKLGVPK